MAEGNGEKSKIIWTLIGLLQMILAGWAWRISDRVDNAVVQIARIEEQTTSIRSTVDSLKEAVWRRRDRETGR